VEAKSKVRIAYKESRASLDVGIDKDPESRSNDFANRSDSPMGNSTDNNGDRADD